MATVNIAFVRAMDGDAPVVACIPAATQTITSSGASQASTITAGNNNVCQITATGGPVWVKFGAAPTATVGGDWLIADGQTREFGHIQAGTKVAVLSA